MLFDVTTFGFATPNQSFVYDALSKPANFPKAAALVMTFMWRANTNIIIIIDEDGREQPT